MVESVPYRHFGDLLRAPVRHVNAHWMYAWFLPVAAKQLMAMVLGGICGVLTLIGGAGLLWRRLTNQRVRATSTTPDIIIMSIFADPVSAGAKYHTVFSTVS
ncbi:respiratory nitrate reductase 2 gamma chain [Escherichia coli]|uniref:Respiratory nitrate reductase 2 gamma chain n=1 Tax=Escherichia coli TaxID=562 RepID=A0A2X3K6T7_ECOLX|nr:respiratory nitrate reductase 2 gamma chain [Escherichia coli]